MHFSLSCAGFTVEYAGPGRLAELAHALIQLERRTGHLPHVSMRLLRDTERRALAFGHAEYPGFAHLTLTRLEGADHA